MSKIKNTPMKQLMLGAALIAGVATIAQHDTFLGSDADEIKRQWNRSFQDVQSHHVERLSGLPLFAVYTKEGVFFTDDEMVEVIQGRRMAPNGGELIPLSHGSNKIQSVSNHERLTEKESMNLSKSVSKDIENNTPIATNRELVERLKEEFAKAKKAQIVSESNKSGINGLVEENKGSNNSSKASVPKINPDEIREDKQFVYYNGSKINKIQYDPSGQVVTDDERRSRIKKIFDSAVRQGDGWTIPYLAENEKLKMLVFSDPTCPYCQRLHRDIDRLNKAGISVYYMLYPRALVRGSEDKSAQAVISMMNTFWCSDKPQATMDKIYNHEYVEPSDQCFAKEQGRTDLPVQEHFLLGRIFNLAATPLTVLSDGRLLYGYGGFSKFMERVGDI